MIQCGQPSKPNTVLYSVFPNYELNTEKYFWFTLISKYSMKRNVLDNQFCYIIDIEKLWVEQLETTLSASNKGKIF